MCRIVSRMTTDVSPEVPANQRTYDEQLGEAVHQVLWRRRIKQGDFAEQVLGITQSALSNKLRGKRPFFAGELSIIAAHLDMSVADLMPPIEIEPPDPPPARGAKGGTGAPTRTRTWDLRITWPQLCSEATEKPHAPLRKAS